MLNLSLRQIRTVLALSRHGRVTHAAAELGLTSPAVTLQLQQMEAELEAQLFLRTRKGMQPTEAGRIVIGAAHRIADEMLSLEETLRALKGVEAGSIRLGVVSTGKYFAPRIIAAFSRLYPGIAIALFAANRAEIIAKLRDHEIDVALMGRPPEGFDVRATLFGDHPHVFIAAPGHELVGRLDITREALARQRFIMRERGSGTRSLFEFFMGGVPGGPLVTPTEMDSNETIKQAVMAGLGIAFLSGHTVEQECEARKLVILDVEETPIRRHWYAISHAARTPTPAMQALDDFLRREGARLLPNVSKPYRA